MGMRETATVSETSKQMSEGIRILPVEDVLDILRLILRVEPLDVLLQKTVDTISDAFGIKQVCLGVLMRRPIYSVLAHSMDSRQRGPL